MQPCWMRHWGWKPIEFTCMQGNKEDTWRMRLDKSSGRTEAGSKREWRNLGLGGNRLSNRNRSRSRSRSRGGYEAGCK